MQAPLQEFHIGPCAVEPGAQPCWKTRARNLTPDNATGIGRFTERQIFNALRFGLRPGETPDVTITSMTPGEGNFPKNPQYLAPPMPWPEWRYMSDRELWAIAAYLKRGLKPVHNKVRRQRGAARLLGERVHARQARPLPVPAVPAGERAGAEIVSA